MTSAVDEGPRTYGNWRRARGFGVGQLGPGQTLAMFAAVVVPIITANFALTAGLVMAAGAAVFAAAVLIRVDGQSAVDAVLRRARFLQARRAGWTELSGGLLAEHPRGADLPGPLAPVVPLRTDDGRGGEQGLLWDRRTGWLTAVIRVSPVGLDLADREQADAWVAAFGGFLADLGFHAMVRHVGITVDTAPLGGSTLGNYIRGRIDPDAPPAAVAVLTDLVAATPTTSSDVEAHVSITFDPGRATPRPPDLLAAVAEVTRWLPSLEAGLASCGVAVLGRATVAWLTGRLRLAYDPASRPDVARALTGADGDVDELLIWTEAGPVRASEQWDRWLHDSGISVSFAMAEAPRQAVLARVLAPLLSAGPYPRRVTMLYEPFAAAAAADEVEREVSNLAVRRAWAQRTRRDPTERERADAARAHQAAQEEAEGAGVGRFCLYVSTTVLDADHLPAAVADLQGRAGQAKLRLRRLFGAQAAGFAAALGVGVNPVELGRRSRR
ncbi:MAG: SCO6880 family protein [Dehalococcoidia bacterium]